MKVKVTPPPDTHHTHPAVYLSQPVKTVKQFVNDLMTPPTNSPLHSRISYVHPGGLSPYSMCKLDIPGLESHSPCMNGQQVGILHQAHHVVFCCFVESLESTLGPSHWALDNHTTFIIDIWNDWCSGGIAMVSLEFPVCDLFNESV